MNKHKQITLYDTKESRNRVNWRPEYVVELIAWLQNLIEEVPEEYRDSVHIDFIGGADIYGENSDVDEVIYYNRPPTQEEIDADLETARVRQEKREAQEREEYAKLKAKFEP